MTTNALNCDPRELIALKDAARQWPGRSKALHVSALFRFSKQGTRGVRLKTVVAPGTGRCTTWAWIREFIAAINATSDPDATPSTSQRRAGQRVFLRDQIAGVGGDHG